MQLQPPWSRCPCIVGHTWVFVANSERFRCGNRYRRTNVILQGAVSIQLCRQATNCSSPSINLRRCGQHCGKQFEKQFEKPLRPELRLPQHANTQIVSGHSCHVALSRNLLAIGELHRIDASTVGSYGSFHCLWSDHESAMHIQSREIRSFCRRIAAWLAGSLT